MQNLKNGLVIWKEKKNSTFNNKLFDIISLVMNYQDWVKSDQTHLLHGMCACSACVAGLGGTTSIILRDIWYKLTIDDLKLWKEYFHNIQQEGKFERGQKNLKELFCLNLILCDPITSIICWYHIWASRTERSKVNKLLSGMNRSGLASYHLANHVHRKENIPFQEWKKMK